MRHDDLSFDRDYIRQRLYGADDDLAVRRSIHQRFSEKQTDFNGWVLGLLDLTGRERVLDIGCGPGDLLLRMAGERDTWRQLIGLDLSAGMVSAGRGQARREDRPVSFICADAQALPFPNASFDLVMARHMLYHVPDIHRALAEAARVLAPDGAFLVVTNSRHTMPQYARLWKEAARHASCALVTEAVTTRFCIENGPAYLERHFSQVQVHLLEDALVFPTAEPLLDYFASARWMKLGPEHSQADWETVYKFARRAVEAEIAHCGHFRVDKITGAIVARGPLSPTP